MRAVGWADREIVLRHLAAQTNDELRGCLVWAQRDVATVLSLAQQSPSILLDKGGGW